MNNFAKEDNTIAKFILKFLKIGAVGFGGGSALIPVIQGEIKDIGHKVSKEEFEKDVVVASITPGALPVEIAAGVGEHVHGAAGMWLSAFAMAVPGAVMMLLFLAVFASANTMVITGVGIAAIGINMLILVVITDYIIGVVRSFEKNRRILAAVMVFAVFALTAGKELRALFHIEKDAILDISTIAILMIAYFVVLYTRGNFRSYRTVVAGVLSGLYLLGKSGLLPSQVMTLLVVVMWIMAMWGLVDALRKSKRAAVFDKAKLVVLLRESGLWIGTMVVLCLPAIIISWDSLQYIVRGIWSCVVSFGGGDAYLSISDGIFVADGIIGEQIFYRRIVPVANALPGSILCKVLAGIGFVMGYDIHGSQLDGLWFALAGLAISISMSCLVFMIVRYVYECFENLYIFRVLKRWTGTIIAGLLLTVGVSVLQESMEFLETEGMPLGYTILVCAGIYLLNLVWEKKSKKKSLSRILVSAALPLLCYICLV